MQPRALIQLSGFDRWLECGDAVTVLEARNPMDVRAVLTAAETDARRLGLHAVGFVSYEAAPGLDAKLATCEPGALPAAWFALFRRCRPTSAPPAAAAPELEWRADVDEAGYHAAIGRIRDYIGAGDTYQVNFSYRLRASCPRLQPEALFRSMVAGQRRGLGAFLEADTWAVCSASPELFFERQGRRLLSRPMKGTAPRGRTAEEDEARARWLAGSSKNRAENVMITDMVRNDIGRIAVPGSVTTAALCSLEQYPTVWQMTSDVSARSEASLARVFEALFPAASITGAPKRRTMEIIRELEASARGIYTGAVGLVTPAGDARFSVAIRTALVDKAVGCAQYGVGGGIVWDSEAAEELTETRTKARILGARAGTRCLAAAPRAAVPPREDFELLETLLWEDGRYFLLERHLRRLEQAAAFFGRRYDRRAVTEALVTFAATLPSTPQRVRLLVNAAGVPAATAAPLVASTAPLRVVLATQPRHLADDPFVRHKTTRRHVYDEARREAATAEPRAQDVLLVNVDGHVTESTVANLVLDVEGTLVTPPATDGLLPGVYREELLATGQVVEGSVTADDVRRARAVYLANSVRRLWRVELL